MVVEVAVEVVEGFLVGLGGLGEVIVVVVAGGGKLEM